jgi:hypothetical protein
MDAPRGPSESAIYPVEITAETAKGRPDLKSQRPEAHCHRLAVGTDGPQPNPAFYVEVPLATHLFRSKEGKEG